RPATRASIDGPVDGNLTYEQWSKSRPKAKSNDLRPLKITGDKSLESIQWTDLAFGAAIEAGLSINKVKVTETSAGFRLTAKTGGFDMQIEKDKSDLILRHIELPEKFRRKGIGTDIVNGLKAIVNTYDLKKGSILAGSSDYPKGAFIWLSSGLVQPSKDFKNWLYSELEGKKDYGRADLYEVSKYLDTNNYRDLLTKTPYAGDIKKILRGRTIKLIIV
ncbi:MAG: hypothetical protein L3J47_12490, partial [Sulfurovum sp.]|nr:hypothetical protein [Sulfurovum sp.]